MLATEVIPAAELSTATAEKRVAEAEAAYAAAEQNEAALQIVLDRVHSARAMLEAASAA